LQVVDVSCNGLTTLKPLSSLKHLLKLNASSNKLTKMLDFDPPAALEWADLSDN
jgi:Leucine-rich repeat (LRR) protein